MAATGLTVRDRCPWNAYPFARDDEGDSKLTPYVVARGAVILTDVLSLVTDLKVLILQGDEAKWAWAMVQAFRPRYGLATVQLGDVVSPARTRGRTQGNRRREKAQQFDACRRVADIVHER